jgi:large subunit ribosomal protein L9
MQVILQRDVPKVGAVGDIVNVKPGYARNYLVPQGMALVADARSVRRIEHAKQLTQHALKKAASEAQGVADAISKIDVTIAMKVGANDKLFGSVTNRDIAKELVAAGHPIDSRRVIIEEPIKSLGVFQVPIKLAGGVVAEVKVWVVADRSAVEEVTEEAPAEVAEAASVDAEAAAEADEPVAEATEDPVEEAEAVEV